MSNENNGGSWGRDDERNNPFARTPNPDTEGFPAQPGPKPPQYRTNQQNPSVQVFVQQPPVKKKGAAIALGASAVLAVVALVGAGVYALTSGGNGDEDLTADGSQETSTVVIGTTTLTRPPTATNPRPTATNGTGTRTTGTNGSSSGTSTRSTGSNSSGSGSGGSTNSRRTTTRSTPGNSARTTNRTNSNGTAHRNTPRATPTPTPEPEEPAYTPDLTTLSCSSDVLVLASVDADSSSLESSIESAKSMDSSAVVVTSGSCSGLSATYGSGYYLVVVDYGSDTSSLCSAADAGSGTAIAAGDGSDPCTALESDDEDA